MEAKKPYLEAFFVAMPNNGAFGVFPISQAVYHALEPITAEIAVPCNRENADYGITLMLLHKENYELAFAEIAYFQEHACELVDHFILLFKSPLEWMES